MALASVIVTMALPDGFLKSMDSGHQVCEASFHLVLPLPWHQRKLSINFGSWKIWSCQNEKNETAGVSGYCTRWLESVFWTQETTRVHQNTPFLWFWLNHRWKEKKRIPRLHNLSIWKQNLVTCSFLKIVPVETNKMLVRDERSTNN